MTPTLITKRLTLRPFAMSDALAINDALNHADVATWLTVVPNPYTLKDAEDFIRDFTTDPAMLHWAITQGGQLIGAISCKPDLGYWLHADHHGRGLMTEAAVACVDHHFATTDADLISGYHLGNAASANVLAKLGFADTHVETQTKAATGQPVQIQRMVLTKDKWVNR